MSVILLVLKSLSPSCIQWPPKTHTKEKGSSHMPRLDVHRCFKLITAQTKGKAPLNQLNGSYNYYFYSPANILAVVPVLQWNQLNNCLLQNNEIHFIDNTAGGRGQKSKKLFCLLSSCKHFSL